MSRVEVPRHLPGATLLYELSFSVGVAEYEVAAPCMLDEFLRRADRAMYERRQRRKEQVPGGVDGDAARSNSA